MFNFKMINLNGLSLIPSEDYTAHIEGLFDSNNENTTSKLFTDGEYLGTYRTSSKKISIIVIREKDNFKSFMQLNYLLNQGEINLDFQTTIDDRVLTCKILKESIIYNEFGNCVINCRLCDPNIYLKDYKELILEKQVEGGWKFPTSSFTIPSSWVYTENVIGNIGECINEGYSTVYPVIEIIGEGSDFKIINETTKEQLNLNINIEAGQVLYVDCNPASRCVKRNEESVIKHKTGAYISLVTGSNSLKVDYFGECTVNVKWRESWI